MKINNGKKNKFGPPLVTLAFAPKFEGESSTASPLKI